MDAIRTASQALQSAVTPNKGHRAVSLDVEKAINQLPSISTLLELSTPSATTIARLAELLRQQLLPLYRSSLSHALNYAVCVFYFIHREKITPAARSTKRKYEWEILLKSLLSGILDFLEGEQNAKVSHREIVASTLFPVLCPLFFAAVDEPTLKVDDGLKSIVYMLLTTIVDGHGKNATKLRDHIGSGRLGLTISQTRGFLALETILDLFATLLPSLRRGRIKRTQFIEKVFDTSLFICSKEIIHSLESITSSDWSKTASNIMQLLAASDISYPQSFEVYVLSGIIINMDAPLSFIADEDKFIGNIDQGGNIDTFQLPFHTIKTITVSSVDTKSMQINVGVTKLPILGDQTSPTIPGEDMFVSWSIKTTDFNRFKDCLISRKLNFNTVGSRKQSKTGEIKLDFDTHNEETSKSKSEKVQSLSQLWKSGSMVGPVPQTDLCTSPLAPQSSKSVKVVPNPINTPPFLPITAQLLPNKQPPGGVQDTGLSDDDTTQFKSRVMKLKRRIIAISDDDDSDNDAMQTESPQKGCRTAIERDDVLNHDVPFEPLIPPVKEVTPQLEGTFDIIDIRKRTPPIERREALPFPPDKKSSHKPTKRKSRDLEEEEYNLHQNTRNTKYNTTLEHPPAKCSPSPPYPPKKYGKQGKGLFPPRLADTSPIVDFDAIPTSDLPKSRPVAMKGKNGRHVQNAKHPPVKKQVINGPQKADGIKGRARQSLDPDITLVNSSEILPKGIDVQVMNGKEDSRTKRRSERVANYAHIAEKSTSRHDITRHVDDVLEKKTRKPAKAPWEADTFTEQISSDIVMGTVEEIQNHRSEDTDAIMVLENDPFSGDIVSNGIEPSYSEEYTDHIVPTKLGSVSNSTPSDPGLTTVMIDLTLEEDSPEPQGHAPSKKKSSEDIQTTVSKIEEEVEVTPSVNVPKLDARLENKVDNDNVRTKTLKNQKENTRLEPEDQLSETTKGATFRTVPQESDDNSERVETYLGDKGLSDDSNEGYANQIPRIEKMPPPPPPKRSIAGERKVDFDLPESRSSGIETNRKNQTEGRLTARRHHPADMRAPKRTRISKPMEEEQRPMDKIIEVLKEINEAVIARVAGRFEGVTEELYAGQRMILEGTADALQEMLHQRVRHFNDLVDLEGEYTARCQNIDAGVGGYLKSTEQLADSFKSIVLEQSRQSLSAKLPTTLL